MNEGQRAALLLGEEIEKTEVVVSFEQNDEEERRESEVESRPVPVDTIEKPKLDEPAPAKETKVPDDGEKPVPVKGKKKKSKKVHTCVLLEAVLRLEGDVKKVVAEQQEAKKAVTSRTRQIFLDQATKAELKEFRAEVQEKFSGMEEQIKELHGGINEIKEMLMKLTHPAARVLETPELLKHTGIPKRKRDVNVPDKFWEYVAALREVQKKMGPAVFGFKSPPSTDPPMPPGSKGTSTAPILLDKSPPSPPEKKLKREQ